MRFVLKTCARFCHQVQVKARGGGFDSTKFQENNQQNLSQHSVY